MHRVTESLPAKSGKLANPMAYARKDSGSTPPAWALSGVAGMVVVPAQPAVATAAARDIM